MHTEPTDNASNRIKFKCLRDLELISLFQTCLLLVTVNVNINFYRFPYLAIVELHVGHLDLVH